MDPVGGSGVVALDHACDRLEYRGLNSDFALCFENDRHTTTVKRTVGYGKFCSLLRMRY